MDLPGLTDALLAFAAAPWVLAVVFVFCIIDGFLPVLPSETLVIALAALTVAGGGPDLVPLAIVTAAGAVLGDVTAYRIGRVVGVPRWLRGPRAARAFGLASRQFDKRPAALLLVGRYIPIGRVAVNITAGIVALRFARFLALDIVACCGWATFSVALGALAGRWAGDNPLLAAALAVVVAIVLAVVIDRVLALRGARGAGSGEDNPEASGSEQGGSPWR